MAVSGASFTVIFGFYTVFGSDRIGINQLSVPHSCRQFNQRANYFPNEEIMSCCFPIRKVSRCETAPRARCLDDSCTCYVRCVHPKQTRVEKRSRGAPCALLRTHALSHFELALSRRLCVMQMSRPNMAHAAKAELRLEDALTVQRILRRASSVEFMIFDTKKVWLSFQELHCARQSDSVLESESSSSSFFFVGGAVFLGGAALSSSESSSSSGPTPIICWNKVGTWSSLTSSG